MRQQKSTIAGRRSIRHADGSKKRAKEDLALMEKFMRAHERRGTTPPAESLERYEALRRKVQS